MIESRGPLETWIQGVTQYLNISFIRAAKKVQKNIYFFCRRVIKWILLPPAEQTNPFFEAPIKKYHVQHRKEILILADHKVDFIAPCEANKSIF